MIAFFSKLHSISKVFNWLSYHFLSISCVLSTEIDFRRQITTRALADKEIAIYIQHTVKTLQSGILQ